MTLSNRQRYYIRRRGDAPAAIYLVMKKDLLKSEKLYIEHVKKLLSEGTDALLYCNKEGRSVPCTAHITCSESDVTSQVCMWSCQRPGYSLIEKGQQFLRDPSRRIIFSKHCSCFSIVYRFTKHTRRFMCSHWSMLEFMMYDFSVTVTYYVQKLLNQHALLLE